MSVTDVLRAEGAFPDMDQLAREAGVSVDALQQSLRDLRTYGYLEFEGEPAAGVHYRALIPEMPPKHRAARS